MASIKKKVRTKKCKDEKTGEIREEIIGYYWRARYRDNEGNEHCRHFERKSQAQAWIDGETAKLVTGTWTNPKTGKKTFKEYAAEWEKNQVAGDAVLRINDNALRLHIVPTLGPKPIRSIVRSDVQGLIKSLTLELGAGSVRNVYDVLQRVMEAAQFDKVIPATPCVKISLPAMPDTEVVPPSVDVVQELADLMPSRLRAAVVLLAGSGVRIGELLGAKVSDVDFLRRTLHVERQRKQNGELAPPKSAKSVRTIPLAQIVIDELSAHLAAHPSKTWLFTDGKEGPLYYREWKTLWNDAHEARQTAERSAAKLARRKPTEIEKVVTHDLRHFYASCLISGGASVKQVQAVLGHSSAAITLRVYSHLWPGDEDRTRSIVDAALSVLRTECGPKLATSGSAAGQEVI